MKEQASTEFLAKQSQPMRQSMYWFIYVSCAYILALKTVEASTLARFELIRENPEIAQYSNFMSYFF